MKRIETVTTPIFFKIYWHMMKHALLLTEGGMIMEVTFLGVGEAFDEKQPNTSILIRSDAGTSSATLLLDCGFTVPPQFWRQGLGAGTLDGVWISHFHGDHTFGLPALVLRFWEEGRREALTIMGQEGIESFTREILNLAYPGFPEKLGFPLRFIEIEPNNRVEILGLVLRTAHNEHSRRDLALRIDAGETSVYYSGDGRPSADCVALAKDTGLIIQEAFHTETEIPGHSTVLKAIDMAKESGAANLALVHIERHVRQQLVEEMGRYRDMARPLNLLLPEPGDRKSL